MNYMRSQTHVMYDVRCMMSEKHRLQIFFLYPYNLLLTVDLTMHGSSQLFSNTCTYSPFVDYLMAL
jgi:hypothetical protein